jgi:hypothetical protein
LSSSRVFDIKRGPSWSTEIKVTDVAEADA